MWTVNTISLSEKLTFLLAQDLVIAHTAYSPMSDEKPTVYAQNTAMANLLYQTVGSSKRVLENLHLSREHPGLKATANNPKMNLGELARLGTRDHAISWAVFQALWTELMATSPAPGFEENFTPRPPVLVTVDGLSHWMKNSNYRSAEFEPIHAFDLVIINHFMSLLKPGKAHLPNGGILLYATSTSNCPTIPTFDVALKQVEARQSGVDDSSPEFPHPEPYGKTDLRVLDAFSPDTPSTKEGQLELQRLGGLSRDEARGYMNYFAQSGLLREVVNDETVGEKWSLAGGGVVGELEKLGKRVRVIA